MYLRINAYTMLFSIKKYSSTLYIGMDEVFAHYACMFENSNLHFHFQWYKRSRNLVGIAWATDGSVNLKYHNMVGGAIIYYRLP